MTLKEMEKRLQALEDLEEIKKLHRKYISYLDNLEFEKALDLFTEDAIAEVRNFGPRRGKKEIAEIYLGVLAKRTTRKDGTWWANPISRLKGIRQRAIGLCISSFPNLRYSGCREEMTVNM